MNHRPCIIYRSIAGHVPVLPSSGRLSRPPFFSLRYPKSKCPSLLDGHGRDGLIGLDWIGLDWIGLDWIGFELQKRPIELAVARFAAARLPHLGSTSFQRFFSLSLMNYDILK